MYKTIEDFKQDWAYEHESTVKMFKALSDASLSQKVSPDGRSLGYLAWHIVVTLGEMGAQAGLTVQAPAENAPVPGSASAIAEHYEKSGQSMIAEVASKWNDASLAEQIPMYGETWTRSQTLAALVKHQIHHRAQMTVLMRQAGLKVPGIYGPAKEEWAQYGMPAHE